MPELTHLGRLRSTAVVGCKLGMNINYLLGCITVWLRLAIDVLFTITMVITNLT
jgi:hypothetical protein